MVETEQLSLSWDAHQKSICSGLSLLQQRGEFVDMTLAADGHHVKVHQMVLSLVSPYIKDLISTAQCPHPVIFLNNISYTTLCAILEYIYTGEVLVSKERLPDLLAAGKALHIKGLREMDDTKTADVAMTKPAITTNASPQRPKSISDKLRALREKKKAVQSKEEAKAPPQEPVCKIYLDETKEDDFAMNTEDSSIDVQDEPTAARETTCDTTATHDSSNDGREEFNVSHNIIPEDSRIRTLSRKVQYSVSNQGGLQVIYNRFIYHLRYNAKKSTRRLWRCIDYQSNLKCSANISTDENNKVTERSFTHNHGFHDAKILKKARSGIIYSILEEAETKAYDKKKLRRVPYPASPVADDTE